MVEILGEMLCVDMMESWSPDDTFFDLLRDKEAINAVIKHAGTKATADGNITATAKVQKGIIRDYLDGTRKGARRIGSHVTCAFQRPHTPSVVASVP